MNSSSEVYVFVNLVLSVGLGWMIFTYLRQRSINRSLEEGVKAERHHSHALGIQLDAERRQRDEAIDNAAELADDVQRVHETNLNLGRKFQEIVARSSYFEAELDSVKGLIAKHGTPEQIARLAQRNRDQQQPLRERDPNTTGAHQGVAQELRELDEKGQLREYWADGVVFDPAQAPHVYGPDGAFARTASPPHTLWDAAGPHLHSYHRVKGGLVEIGHHWMDLATPLLHIQRHEPTGLYYLYWPTWGDEKPGVPVTQDELDAAMRIDGHTEHVKHLATISRVAKCMYAAGMISSLPTQPAPIVTLITTHWPWIYGPQGMLARFDRDNTLWEIHEHYSHHVINGGVITLAEDPATLAGSQGELPINLHAASGMYYVFFPRYQDDESTPLERVPTQQTLAPEPCANGIGMGFAPISLSDDARRAFEVPRTQLASDVTLGDTSQVGKPEAAESTTDRPGPSAYAAHLVDHCLEYTAPKAAYVHREVAAENRLKPQTDYWPTPEDMRAASRYDHYQAYRGLRSHKIDDLAVAYQERCKHFLGYKPT